MSAIGPGDLVECVDDSGTPDVKRGLIYEVVRVSARFLYLAGVSEIDAPYNGMFVHRFRPIRRDELQIFRDIVAKPKVDA